MNGKLLLCSISLQMHDKLLPSVFTTTIRMENLDISLVLCLAIGFEALVSFKSVALGLKEMEIGKLSFVISEADIVTATMEYERKILGSNTAQGVRAQ